jgi:hypothetical protein
MISDWPDPQAALLSCNPTIINNKAVIKSDLIFIVVNISNANVGKI